MCATPSKQTSSEPKNIQFYITIIKFGDILPIIKIKESNTLFYNKKG